MKFTAPRSALSEALSVVSRAVASRTTVPILSNILVEAGGDGLRLAATNLAFAVDCHLAANVEQPGAITLPGVLLVDAISKMTGAGVTIETDNAKMSAAIFCGEAKLTVRGLAAEDFPRTEIRDDGNSFEVDAGLLSSMLKQTTFAASDDWSRPNICCLNLLFGAKCLSFVATDGYRLALRCANLNHGIKPQSVLVRADTMVELGRVLAKADAEQPVVVQLAKDGRSIAFGVNGAGDTWFADFNAQTVDGKYPDYQAILPKTRDTTAAVHRETLLRAISVAKLFTQREKEGISMPVRLNIDAEGGRVEIRGDKSESGVGSDAVAADVKGKSLDFVIDANYLRDSLASIDDSQVVIEVTTPQRPICVRPYSAGPDEFKHVIMPIYKTT
jgi:DNA polymerase-3 subunit beta